MKIMKQVRLLEFLGLAIDFLMTVLSKRFEFLRLKNVRYDEITFIMKKSHLLRS